ncbi:hypothetical protein Nepgr_021143 [Nepenthes gracilis]|uniref:PIN-like protein n=1 Tax=Nepenthes gracilis TaxID=150966 RepID=A0AAD3XVP7_NEPGR|nr:hypothetical protein Nepgr_021143 [Nepenthes gracilis]
MLSAAAGVCSNVLSAIVPLYVAMIMAYVSVKYLRMFTPDQCAGINKFVSKFSVPLLSFRVISTTNPYKINMKLAMSDLLQKILAFMALLLVAKIMSPRSRFDLVITGVSLSTLPNTLIVGIPLLKALYGAEAAALLAQIVLLQSLVWYNLLLLMFELNSAVAISASSSPQVPG